MYPHGARLIAGAAMALVAGCHGAELSNTPSPDSGATQDQTRSLPAIGAARTLGVLDHAIFAFRNDAGAITGSAAAQRAVVRAGRVELTPYTFDAGARAARAPLTFGTASIASGGRLLAGADVQQELVDGAVMLRRGSAVERLSNEPDGVHQEWRFASAPGAGDLAIEVEIAGVAYQTTTAGGVHFSGDHVGIRYSHAVWSDATGQTWPIDAAYDAASRRIRMVVPARIVAASQFPALLDPTISAESDVDVPIASTTGANTSNPSVAFDGTNYLAVWADLRDGDLDVWGTRWATDGTLLDPIGFRIAGGAGNQTNPAVAFDGARYVVVWEDYKIAGGTEADIGAATVTPGGVVTALPAVASTSASETTPAIAGGGGAAFVAWAAGGQIMGAQLAGSFGAPFAVTATANAHREPAVAAGAAGAFLVVFTETTATTSDDVRGQLIASGGLAGSVFDIAAGKSAERTAAASFDGTNYDVVWSSNYPGVEIYGTRISTAGAVLDTHLESTVPVGGTLINHAANYQETPSIACTASGCLVSWQDKRNVGTNGYDVYGQVVSTAFALVGTETAISTVALNQQRPRVAASPSGYAVVWQDQRAGGNAPVRIVGARVSAAGGLLDAAGIVLDTATNREQLPAAARSGSTLALAWNDTRSTLGDDIEMVRFTSSGAALDSSAIAVSTAPYTQSTASAAGFGSSFVVTWADTRSNNSDIYAARVDVASGALLDTSGRAVATTADQEVAPSVASSGAEALVVWEDATTGATKEDILGAIIDSSGAVSAPFAISNASADQGRPVVAYDASNGQYVVAWIDTRSGGSDVYGARVTPSGSVLDAGGVMISVGGRRNLKLAAGASSLLAVYDAGADIFATPLTAGAALTPGTELQITTDPAVQIAPAVAPIGSSFLVVWTDARSLSTTQTDIWGQLVTSGALTGSNFAVSEDAEVEASVTAIDATASSVLVGYRKTDPSLDADRLMVRTVDLNVTPTLVSIAVTPTNPSVMRGQTQAFTATGTYSDGTSADVTASATWSSSAPGVATMAGNVASAIGVGTSTIQATVGAVSGSTTLTVTPPILVSIGVSPTDPSIAKGTTDAFTATGLYSDGSTQDLTGSVTWASSNTTVATITTGGVATALAVGTSTISATLGAVSGSTSLTVTAAVLVEIDVEPLNPSIAKNTTQAFTATGFFSDMTAQDMTTQVTWSSANTAVATIDSAGLATGVAAGTSTITATFGTLSDTATLTVTNATVTSIAVTPAAQTIAKLTTLQYKATATFSDLTTQDLTSLVTWSSTNTAAATISTTGLATGVAGGTTTIRATFSGVTGSTGLTVTNATLTSIAVTPNGASLIKHFTMQFTAIGTFSDGSTQNITGQAAWASSNILVATVSNATATKGLATGTGGGTTTISATLNGVTGSATLTGLNIALLSISVTPSTSTVAVGSSRQLTATGIFTGGVTLNITTQVAWRTSRKKTVTVNESGLVTGIKAGAVTISARKLGKTGTATVTAN